MNLQDQANAYNVIELPKGMTAGDMIQRDPCINSEQAKLLHDIYNRQASLNASMMNAPLLSPSDIDIAQARNKIIQAKHKAWDQEMKDHRG